MKEVTEGLRPIKEGLENLHQVITFPAYPSITADEGPYFLGDIAERYLKKFATKSEADTTHGLYNRKGKFYIVTNQLALMKMIS